MKFGFMKGQGATEYLVLLAVVLIIALVSIALLGFFPGLAGDARKTQSDSYWRGEARPFAILEASATSTALSLVVQNVESDQRTLIMVVANTAGNTNATAAGNGGSTAAGQVGVWSGGEKKSVSVVLVGACTSGSTYSYNTTFFYNSADLTGQKFTGSKDLIVKCV